MHLLWGGGGGEPKTKQELPLVRKTAFRRIVSGVRPRTNIGESASADKVLSI